MLEKDLFTSTDLHKLFQMNSVAPNTLIAAEKAGHIPKARRVHRGRIEVRQWTLAQVPAIGAKYGFLEPPKSLRVICVYTAKGGVLKSTLSYSLGRLLALHGIKTLIIGLDIQGTVTDLALNPIAIESLEEVTAYKGLADVLLGKSPLKKVIRETPLPTLDIIPETPGLGPLEKFIRDTKRREFVLKEQVIAPLANDYQVIIFDNSPNWNLLIENALTAANVVISPIGCDLGSYQALSTNLSTTLDFQKDMHIEWDNVILVPTLLEKNKLSSQIYGAYLTQHPGLVTHTAIRRAVRGQEALTMRQSAPEYDPKSDLARDYYDLVKEVWSRILKAEK
jgi:chromosome partitioning protein